MHRGKHRVFGGVQLAGDRCQVIVEVVRSWVASGLLQRSHCSTFQVRIMCMIRKNERFAQPGVHARWEGLQRSKGGRGGQNRPSERSEARSSGYRSGLLPAKVRLGATSGVSIIRTKAGRRAERPSPWVSLEARA